MTINRLFGALLLGVALLAAPAARAQIAPVVGTGSTLQIKASGGTLLDGYVTTGGAGFLFVFNKATIPVNGSVTAGLAAGNYQDCINITAAGSYALGSFGLPGEQFSAGIYLAFSSTGCSTLTLSSPLFFKARAQ